MHVGRLSATALSGFRTTALSSQNPHNGTSVGPCTCPFCSWSAGRSATSKLSSSPRRPRTVSKGMQTVTEMNFDDWWNVDPQLEARAMVFRTYRQTKPYFAAWIGAVVQTGRSRAIMKFFEREMILLHSHIRLGPRTWLIKKPTNTKKTWCTRDLSSSNNCSA